jgi:hypothetical protein
MLICVHIPDDTHKVVAPGAGALVAVLEAEAGHPAEGLQLRLQLVHELGGDGDRALMQPACHRVEFQVSKQQQRGGQQCG